MDGATEPWAHRPLAGRGGQDQAYCLLELSIVAVEGDAARRISRQRIPPTASYVVLSHRSPYPGPRLTIAPLTLTEAVLGLPTDTEAVVSPPTETVAPAMLIVAV